MATSDWANGRKYLRFDRLTRECSSGGVLVDGQAERPRDGPLGREITSATDKLCPDHHNVLQIP